MICASLGWQGMEFCGWLFRRVAFGALDRGVNVIECNGTYHLRGTFVCVLACDVFIIDCMICMGAICVLLVCMHDFD